MVQQNWEVHVQKVMRPMTSGKTEALKVSQVAGQMDKQNCRLMQTHKAMALHGCCCRCLSKSQTKTPAVARPLPTKWGSSWSRFAPCLLLKPCPQKQQVLHILLISNLSSQTLTLGLEQPLPRKQGMSCSEYDVHTHWQLVSTMA